MSKVLERRIARLETRAGMDDPWDISDEALLERVASVLCSLASGEIRKLQDQCIDPSARANLPDRERLALAIVSAEWEAMHTLLRTHNNGSVRGLTSMDEVFERIFEEWQRLRAEQAARGYKVGRTAPGWIADRMFGD